MPLLIVAAVVVCAWVLAVIIPNWQWYGDAEEIEAHLSSEIPLGSSEEQVLSRLRAKGLTPSPLWRGEVEPNTGYPPNTVAGTSLVRATVAKYRLPFVTSVEVFYIFGPDRRLVEIAVRKTTDAF